MAVQSDVMEASGPYDRARALNAFKFGDVTFYWITRASAISVLLILGGIILSLIVGAWPAMREYGFSFLFTSRWAPSADPPVLGALGETMAVTFIIGNSFRITGSVFSPGTTISAAIASEFAESDGLHQSGLILLGLLLFVLTFFVLASARLMLMRLKKKAGD